MAEAPVKHVMEDSQVAEKEKFMFLMNKFSSLLKKNYLMIKAVKEGYSFSKQHLSDTIQEMNHLEMMIFMESHSLSQLQVVGPELTNHAKKQFYSLINHKCPAASHGFRILLEDAQSENLINYEWFGQMAEKAENLIISPSRMRLERLENQYGDIPLMYCQRELLRVLGIFKDDLVEKCQDFKEFEEQSNHIKAEGRDLVLQFRKLKAANAEKYSLFISELERHLNHDEESLTLNEDFGSFVFTCPEIENESNKCL